MVFFIFVISQFSLADTLFTEGFYEIARVEYQREFFFSPELMNESGKRIRYAISLFKEDEFHGIREFNNTIEQIPDLDKKHKIAIANCYIEAGYLSRAADLLEPVEMPKLLGYTYLLDNRLYTARDHFYDYGYPDIAKDIEHYIALPGKSLRTATLLSIFLPGSGEIYAGNVERGVRDFLLNLGSGFLLYNAFKKKKYVDAVLIFNFLFNRFYMGSIYNAQRTVLEANEKQKMRWLREMENKYFVDER